MIIAILHGRTKEGWYEWIKDRVENDYGYPTPPSPPQIYAQNRLMSFRTRREVQERSRQQQQTGDDDIPAYLEGPFSRVLAANGEISFLHGGAITNDAGSLMFTGDDSDEDEDAEETSSGRSFFTETLGLGRAESPSPTSNLKAQLEEFEKGQRDEDDDFDIKMDDSIDIQSPDGTVHHHLLQGEAPLPPKHRPNGDASIVLPEQLKSQPLGDEPIPVVRAEGLMDTSEDPLLKA